VLTMTDDFTYWIRWNTALLKVFSSATRKFHLTTGTWNWVGNLKKKKNSSRRKHANGKYYAYMFDIAFVGRYISQQQTLNIFLIAPEACVHFREIIKISHSITVAILTKPLRINLISSEVFPKLIFNYI
jgi:hypothetical protein